MNNLSQAEVQSWRQKIKATIHLINDQLGKGVEWGMASDFLCTLDDALDQLTQTELTAQVQRFLNEAADCGHVETVQIFRQHWQY